jgi:hypothetical protein
MRELINNFAIVFYILQLIHILEMPIQYQHVIPRESHCIGGEICKFLFHVVDL